MFTRFVAIVLVASCASILPNYASAQCSGPNCRKALPALSGALRGETRLQLGQPARNAVRLSGAAVRGSARVASLPVKAVRRATQVCQERKPARRVLGRVLRGAKNVVTGNGPILRRVRGRR